MTSTAVLTSPPLAPVRPAAPAPPVRPTRVAVEARPRRSRRPLTAREVQVLSLIADGMTNEEVAKQLGIARHTVKSHMAHILDALGAQNSAHAVAIAHCRGQIEPRRRVPWNADVSYREVQVLEGVAVGMTDLQIGRKLWVSQHTIKSHLRRIYGKLGVCSRAQAVDTAFRSGLLVVRRPH